MSDAVENDPFLIRGRGVGPKTVTASGNGEFIRGADDPGSGPSGTTDDTDSDFTVHSASEELSNTKLSTRSAARRPLNAREREPGSRVRLPGNGDTEHPLSDSKRSSDGAGEVKSPGSRFRSRNAPPNGVSVSHSLKNSGVSSVNPRLEPSASRLAARAVRVAAQSVDDDTVDALLHVKDPGHRGSDAGAEDDHDEDFLVVDVSPSDQRSVGDAQKDNEASSDEHGEDQGKAEKLGAEQDDLTESQVFLMGRLRKIQSALDEFGATDLPLSGTSISVDGKHPSNRNGFVQPNNSPSASASSVQPPSSHFVQIPISSFSSMPVPAIGPKFEAAPTSPKLQVPPQSPFPTAHSNAVSATQSEPTTALAVAATYSSEEEARNLPISFPSPAVNSSDTRSQRAEALFAIASTDSGSSRPLRQNSTIPIASRTVPADADTLPMLSSPKLVVSASSCASDAPLPPISPVANPVEPSPIGDNASSTSDATNMALFRGPATPLPTIVDSPSAVPSVTLSATSTCGPLAASDLTPFTQAALRTPRQEKKFPVSPTDPSLFEQESDVAVCSKPAVPARRQRWIEEPVPRIEEEIQVLPDSQIPSPAISEVKSSHTPLRRSPRPHTATFTATAAPNQNEVVVIQPLTSALSPQQQDRKSEVRASGERATKQVEQIEGLCGSSERNASPRVVPQPALTAAGIAMSPRASALIGAHTPRSRILSPISTPPKTVLPQIGSPRPQFPLLLTPRKVDDVNKLFDVPDQQPPLSSGPGKHAEYTFDFKSTSSQPNATPTTASSVPFAAGSKPLTPNHSVSATGMPTLVSPSAALSTSTERRDAASYSDSLLAAIEDALSVGPSISPSSTRSSSSKMHSAMSPKSGRLSVSTTHVPVTQAHTQTVRGHLSTKPTHTFARERLPAETVAYIATLQRKEDSGALVSQNRKAPVLSGDVQCKRNYAVDKLDDVESFILEHHKELSQFQAGSSPSPTTQGNRKRTMRFPDQPQPDSHEHLRDQLESEPDDSLLAFCSVARGRSRHLQTVDSATASAPSPLVKDPSPGAQIPLVTSLPRHTVGESSAGSTALGRSDQLNARLPATSSPHGNDSSSSRASNENAIGDGIHIQPRRDALLHTSPAQPNSLGEQRETSARPKSASLTVQEVRETLDWLDGLRASLDPQRVHTFVNVPKVDLDNVSLSAKSPVLSPTVPQLPCNANCSPFKLTSAPSGSSNLQSHATVVAQNVSSDSQWPLSTATSSASHVSPLLFPIFPVAFQPLPTFTAPASLSRSAPQSSALAQVTSKSGSYHHDRAFARNARDTVSRSIKNLANRSEKERARRMVWLKEFRNPPRAHE